MHIEVSRQGLSRSVTTVQVRVRIKVREKGLTSLESRSTAQCAPCAVSYARISRARERFEDGCNSQPLPRSCRRTETRHSHSETKPGQSRSHVCRWRSPWDTAAAIMVVGGVVDTQTDQAKAAAHLPSRSDFENRKNKGKIMRQQVRISNLRPDAYYCSHIAPSPVSGVSSAFLPPKGPS